MLDFETVTSLIHEITGELLKYWSMSNIEYCNVIVQPLSRLAKNLKTSSKISIQLTFLCQAFPGLSGSGLAFCFLYALRTRQHPLLCSTIIERIEQKLKSPLGLSPVLNRKA